MLQARIIPVLLLQDDFLVKSVKFKNPTYVGDVINAIKIFNEKEVDEIIVLDINASQNKKGPNFALIEALAGECFMPLCYGGGISTIEHMKKMFEIGVEKISLNTAAIENPLLIKEAIKRFGAQSIVVSMDVKKNFFGNYQLVYKRGKKSTPSSLKQFVDMLNDLGVGEILLTAVDRDGTFSGYDLELIKAIASASAMPIVACGGAGKLADLKAAVNCGASAAAAGSLFVFYGKHRAVLINYPTQCEIRELFGVFHEFPR